MMNEVVERSIIKLEVELEEINQIFQENTMGGPLKCVEPRHWNYLEQNQQIHRCFVEEVLHSYIQEMKGHNMILSSNFMNSQNKGQVAIKSIKFMVILELLGEDTSLECVCVQVESKGMMD